MLRLIALQYSTQDLLARDGQQRERQVHTLIYNSGTNPGTIPSSGLDATKSHSSTDDDHGRRNVRNRTVLGRVIAWMRKWCLKKNKGQAPYVGVWLSVAVGCLIECAYIGSTVAVSKSIFQIILPFGFTN